MMRREGEYLSLPRKAALEAAGVSVTIDMEMFEEPLYDSLWLRVGTLGVLGMLGLVLINLSGVL